LGKEREILRVGKFDQRKPKRPVLKTEKKL
jgi:hypothetical protein